MWGILQHHPRALYESLGLHLFFVVVIFAGTILLPPQIEPAIQLPIIQASLITGQVLEQTRSELEHQLDQQKNISNNLNKVTQPTEVTEQINQMKLQQEAERRAIAEVKTKQRAAEQIRLQQEAKHQAVIEAETKKRIAIEDKRIRQKAEQRAAIEAEIKRKAAEQVKLEAEQQAIIAAKARQQEAERQAVEDEAKKQQTAKQIKMLQAAEARQKAAEQMKAEIERQAAEAEAKQQAAEQMQLQQEIERRTAAEAEAKRQAAAVKQAQAEVEAQQAREADLLAALEAEQVSKEAEGYIPLIQERVKRYWIRPLAVTEKVSTVVKVRLMPGGEVVPDSVHVVKSSGTAAFDQSVIAAIYQASPLPVPTGTSFERFREFQFRFTPP